MVRVCPIFEHSKHVVVSRLQKLTDGTDYRNLPYLTSVNIFIVRGIYRTLPP